MDNQFIVLPEKGEVYLNNLALCKYHLGQDVLSDDFSAQVEKLSKKGESMIFLRLLQWLGRIKNLSLTDFDSWAVHTRKTVDAAAQACGYVFFNTDEKELISLGLAVRTFPFQEGTEILEKYCIPEILSAFLNLEMNKPERALAMEAISDLMIDRMTEDENRDFHLYLKLMRAKVDAHNFLEGRDD